MDSDAELRNQTIRQLKEIQSHSIQNGFLKPSKIKAFNLLISIHIDSLEQYNLDLF